MSATTGLRLTGEDSRTAFDVLLRSLAEPGTVAVVPAGLLPGDVPAAAVLPLALADVDVSVCVLGDAADEAAALAARVAAATLCPTAPPALAALVLLLDPTPEQVRTLRRGAADAPEAAARAALRVGRITPLGEVQAATGSTPEDTVVLQVHGPGVPGSRWIAVAGLDPAVVAALADVNVAFPAGLDVWLADADGRVVGLPRSCSVVVDTRSNHRRGDH
jgi:alpha-D-ribose 1-methylphosphonate 5-triphosphate synthase subunit PhnH